MAQNEWASRSMNGVRFNHHFVW